MLCRLSWKKSFIFFILKKNKISLSCIVTILWSTIYFSRSFAQFFGGLFKVHMLTNANRLISPDVLDLLRLIIASISVILFGDAIGIEITHFTFKTCCLVMQNRMPGSALLSWLPLPLLFNDSLHGRLRMIDGWDGQTN